MNKSVRIYELHSQYVNYFIYLKNIGGKFLCSLKQLAFFSEKQGEKFLCSLEQLAFFSEKQGGKFLCSLEQLAFFSEK